MSQGRCGSILWNSIASPYRRKKTWAILVVNLLREVQELLPGWPNPSHSKGVIERVPLSAEQRQMELGPGSTSRDAAQVFERMQLGLSHETRILGQNLLLHRVMHLCDIGTDRPIVLSERLRIVQSRGRTESGVAAFQPLEVLRGALRNIRDHSASSAAVYRGSDLASKTRRALHQLAQLGITTADNVGDFCSTLSAP